MDIKLDDDYVLGSDNLQFILYKIRIGEKGESKDREFRDVAGYYATIDGALEGYVNEKLLSCEATTVKELLQYFRKLKKFIKEVTV